MNKQIYEGYSRSPFPLKSSEWHLIVKIYWKRTCVANTHHKVENWAPTAHHTVHNWAQQNS